MKPRDCWCEPDKLRTSVEILINTAIINTSILTQAILGPRLLSCLLMGHDDEDAEGGRRGLQLRLFQAILSRKSLQVLDIGAATSKSLREDHISRQYIDSTGCSFSSLTAERHYASVQPALHTPSLLTALAEVSGLSQLSQLILHGIVLEDANQVNLLAVAIMANCPVLRDVRLTGLLTPETAPEGFLDPLVSAVASAGAVESLKLHVVRKYQNYCCATSNGKNRKCSSSLISRQGFQSLFGGDNNNECYWSEVCLRGLGLADNNCEFLSDAISSSCSSSSSSSLSLSHPHSMNTNNTARPQRKIARLDLCDNPDISRAGYRTVLNILNRCSCLRSIQVDDPAVVARFHLLVQLNDKGRLDALRAGAFSDNSRTTWVEWLAKVASSGEVASTNAKDEDEQSMPLDGLWVTVLERPDFIYS